MIYDVAETTGCDIVATSPKTSQRPLIVTIYNVAATWRCDIAATARCDCIVTYILTTYILNYIYKYISKITYFDDPEYLFEMSLKITH